MDAGGRSSSSAKMRVGFAREGRSAATAGLGSVGSAVAVVVVVKSCLKDGRVGSECTKAKGEDPVDDIF